MIAGTHPKTMGAPAPSAAQCCATCRHVETMTDEDGERTYRCGYPVPPWVPLQIADYMTWVTADSGRNCRVHQTKD